MIRTQEKIRDLAAGTLLEVTATDPGTLEDIPAWCRVHGHELITAETLEGDAAKGRTYLFRVRVAGD